MRRLRMSASTLFAVLAVLLVAACNPPGEEATLDATAILIAVQQSQTAAAPTGEPGQPPATSAPPGEPTQAAPTDDQATAAPSDSPEPTPTQTLTPEPTVTPGAGPSGGPTSETPGEPGAISGSLAYPSEVIPRLKVYAWDRDSGQWRYVITNQNDSSYQLQVPPGKYIVFAYLNEGGEIAGGYTNAVLCGLSAGCTDHTLYVVTVGSGQQVSGVNVTDWYGPQGSIPQPPA